MWGWIMLLAQVLLVSLIGCKQSSATPPPATPRMDLLARPRTAGDDSGGMIPVRYSEGSVHGFLVLKDLSDNVLAYGDEVQTADGSLVQTRMRFDFPDGSKFQEDVWYSQDGVFRLKRYTLSAEGPAFQGSQKYVLDAENGRYQIEVRKSGEKAVNDEGDIKLPEDVYNGMASTVAKNILGRGNVRVHYVAFTPKPRVVEIEFASGGQEKIYLGQTSRPAQHFVIKPDLSLLLKIGAALTGQTPGDSHLWIVTDTVPGFVRADATLVPDGPVRRLELTAPRMPEG